MENLSSSRLMERIRSERGLSVKIAKECGISRAAVYQWKRVPVDRVQAVAALLKLKPEQIRPDIFGGGRGGR